MMSRPRAGHFWIINPLQVFMSNNFCKYLCTIFYFALIGKVSLLLVVLQYVEPFMRDDVVWCTMLPINWYVIQLFLQYKTSLK